MPGLLHHWPVCTSLTLCSCIHDLPVMHTEIVSFTYLLTDAHVSLPDIH